MFEKLHFSSFVISFGIGMLFVYAYHPPYEIVYKFPNKYNLDSTTYKDVNGQCYKFESVKATCDGTEKDHPIVEGMSQKKSH